jgi:hypothetical protein
MQGFADEVLRTTKKDEQNMKPKDPKGDSYESRRKQNLNIREVMAVGPATVEYLKWSEVSITFDRSDDPDFVPKLGR